MWEHVVYPFLLAVQVSGRQAGWCACSSYIVPRLQPRNKNEQITYRHFPSLGEGELRNLHLSPLPASESRRTPSSGLRPLSPFTNNAVKHFH